MKALHAYTLALLCTCILMGCEAPSRSDSFKAARQDRTLERVTSSGELRCGYIAWPLLFEIDPNSHRMRGLMHDITEELARRAKLKVVWSEELQFGNIAQALKSGKIDAVCSGVWEITERGRELQFSEAIALNLAKLFVAASSPIRSYRELLAETDLRMATVDGEISSLIKHYTFPVHNEVSLPKESDGPTMLLQLVTRKADFTLTDTGSAQAFHAAYPGALREVADFPTVHFPIAYVALRGEHQLTNLLNLGVRELRRSGVIDALMHRYDPEQSYFTAK